ncbi:MAG: hypothetical protein ACXWNI_07420 [Candidatus Limnocylindrales bacterium]
MVCASCGAQIDSPGKFCAKCGAPLPEAAPVSPTNDFAAVPPLPPEAPLAEDPAAPGWAETPPPAEEPAAPVWAQTPPPPAAPPVWAATPPPAAQAWAPPPAQPAAPPPPPGAPQYGAPQYGAPQYGAPQYGAPQYGAPQYGAPQYAPPYGAPQYAAPAAAGAGTGMIAALLALAGGAVAIGSAWLPWAVTSSGDSLIKPIESTSGSDLANGYYLIAAGAVAAACGLLMLLGMVKTPSARMLLSLGAIAGGAAILVVEFVAMDDVNKVINLGFGTAVSLGLGLWVGAAGGVAAAVGGVLGLVSKR